MTDFCQTIPKSSVFSWIWKTIRSDLTLPDLLGLSVFVMTVVLTVAKVITLKYQKLCG